MLVDDSSTDGTAEIAIGAAAEADLPLTGGAADRLADEVLEGDGARLEPDGIDVREVVADDVEGGCLRVEARQPCRK